MNHPITPDPQSAATFPREKSNRVRRLPEKAAYDRATIYTILDEALIVHVGLVQNGRPYVIPTLFARQEDSLLLHGAASSRLIRVLGAGNEVCLTVTLLDGLVLARSVFEHSANYRSVVLFTRAQLVSDAEKWAALQAFTDKLMPGRWDDARQPTDNELKATTIVRLPIDLASAKVSDGPPDDKPEDLALPVWAGVIPVRRVFDPPRPDPGPIGEVPVPDYLRAFLAQRNTD
jgi:nitroimidazol reductase NimA-like FMN-containing flavoprotein (pyridoxamine 5'-phosphate oxidase superfamily)